MIAASDGILCSSKSGSPMESMRQHAQRGGSKSRSCMKRSVAGCRDYILYKVPGKSTAVEVRPDPNFPLSRTT